MNKSRNEAEIRVRVKRSPRGFVRKVILIVITLYIFFMVYDFIHDLLVIRLAKAEQVKSGVVQTVIEAEGTLVRNEKVLSAPKTGKLKIIAAEGERVRVGQVVAQVIVPSLDSSTGETVVNITAPRAGIISYYLDGLETVFSPGSLKELDLSKFDTIKSEPRRIQAGNQIEEGKPLLKIINNLDPVMIIATVPEGNWPDLDDNKSLSLLFGSTDTGAIPATIVERNFQGTPGQLLLSLRDGNKEVYHLRHVNFRVITERYEGFVVPVRSIVRKNGEDGIYTVYKERVKWKKVTITGGNRQEVVISGITPDVKVILNPEYVEEGSPFK